MDSHALSANLRRLRADRALTQVELANKAQLSLAAYRNIETGKSVPRSATLLALAKALNARWEELLLEPPKLESVRFRSSKRLKSREQILVDVAFRLRDYDGLEQILDARKPFALADVVAPSRRDRASIARLAREARSALELQERETIRDICGLLEDHGVKVLRLRRASEGFFGLSVAPGGLGPAIVVNTWERISVERWIYTAAHELGHLLLSADQYDGEERELDDERAHEREVDLFAALFLMPDAVFWDEWQQAYGLSLLDRVLKVKRIFRVSYKTVLHRVSEQAGGVSKLWAIFQVQHRERFGRTLKGPDEPEALEPDEFSSAAPPEGQAAEPESVSSADFTPDRLCRLVRQGVDRGEISMSRGAEILRLELMAMRQLAASWV